MHSTIATQCTQSRDAVANAAKGANGPPSTRKALTAAPLADFRNVSIANTDATIRKQCDFNMN
jgi:hypothetical protein